METDAIPSFFLHWTLNAFTQNKAIFPKLTCLIIEYDAPDVGEKVERCYENNLRVTLSYTPPTRILPEAFVRHQWQATHHINVCTSDNQCVIRRACCVAEPVHVPAPVSLIWETLARKIKRAPSCIQPLTGGVTALVRCVLVYTEVPRYEDVVFDRVARVIQQQDGHEFVVCGRLKPELFITMMRELKQHCGGIHCLMQHTFNSTFNVQFLKQEHQNKDIVCIEMMFSNEASQ